MWHYRDADPDFGSWQAKELLDHLEGVLSNEPIEVGGGSLWLEWGPFRVERGRGGRDWAQPVPWGGAPGLPAPGCRQECLFAYPGFSTPLRPPPDLAPPRPAPSPAGGAGPVDC